jgi:EAL and modified HD-GYP domain-containing signal transduction protein
VIPETQNAADDRKIASLPAEQPSSLLYFTARQPILDDKGGVFAYELLFRNGLQSYFPGENPEAATKATLDASLLQGLDILCDGRFAFINCTREALLQDYPLLLPSNRTVVEVLENIPADREVIEACRRLRKAGYRIALDDFIADDPREGMVELADVIKVDMRLTSTEQRAEIVRRHGTKHRQMLAEKVETREEFAIALDQGFVLFQGYFFRRPEVFAIQRVPANQVTYIRLLQASSRSELNWIEIEELLKADSALSYRLLRFLNSPVFAFKAEIGSIHQALVMLGEQETRRWIRLAATAGLARHRPGDLLLSTLARARFCELLAERTGLDRGELFLFGLLSLMDAVLAEPMAAVLEKIPVKQETKAALLGALSPFSPISALMRAQDRGDWETILELSRELKLEEEFAAKANWEAMRWAHEVTRGL